MLVTPLYSKKQLIIHLFLTVFGKRKELLNCEKIAIVGSRNSSINGGRFCYKISQELNEMGYIITSGLARGIDTEAHKASLKTGTIAIIAGGIDNIYPLENRELYKQIYENGLIITEQPFGL